MGYVPLYEEFGYHPKVIAAGNEAVGLHCRTMCYVATHLTDGHVDHGVDVTFAGPRARRLRDVLISVGLRDPCLKHDQCSVVHDWHHCNDTTEDLRQRRDQVRDRKRRERAKPFPVTRDMSVTGA